MLWLNTPCIKSNKFGDLNMQPKIKRKKTNEKQKAKQKKDDDR